MAAALRSQGDAGSGQYAWLDKVDEDPVPVCPDCGMLLQTLDLPCPRCSGREQWSEPATHRYSKTFHYKWRPYGYQPERVVEELNGWLETQPGLQQLTMSIHVAPGPVIRGVTLNCTASDEPVRYRARFDR